MSFTLVLTLQWSLYSLTCLTNFLLEGPPWTIIQLLFQDFQNNFFETYNLPYDTERQSRHPHICLYLRVILFISGDIQWGLAHLMRSTDCPWLCSVCCIFRPTAILLEELNQSLLIGTKSECEGALSLDVNGNFTVGTIGDCTVGTVN